MKKLFMFMAAACISLGATAQYANQSVMFGDRTHTVKQSVNDVKAGRAVNASPGGINTHTARKGTAAHDRWYSHYDVVDTINSNALIQSSYLVPIWFDSTVRQRFSTGLGTINFSSLGEVLSPWGFDLFNDINLFGPDEMSMISTDEYVVDSIAIRAAYIKEPNRPTSVVDTLILSVAPANLYYIPTRTGQSWTSAYLPVGVDTLWLPGITSVDSVNRAAFPVANSRQLWKVPLYDADRDTADGTTGLVQTRYFAYAVPGGGVTVPGGAYNTAITVTFKSGDTWTANQDSVTAFHRFMPISGEGQGPQTQMPYYYPNASEDPVNGYNDRNMSSLMFSTDTSFYSPTMAIEGTNTTNFFQEFHDIRAHVTCATCMTIQDRVGVKVISSNITAGHAFPNPANTEVNIPFLLKDAANVNVTLTNAVGQVVSVQHLGKVAATQSQKVVFSTASLAPGMYFYTIDANGQRTTNRIVVDH